jgi:uncharacterized lipoprotein YddW (UPF0748 family)
MRIPSRSLLTLFAATASLVLTSTGTMPAAEEMRAAWVASVFNLNFPSHSGMSADAQRQEIRRLVNLAADRGLNALMVQVRPEGDALYESRLEPWSRYLTGAQGRDPGYDPLAEFIAEGRKRGVAIHAWINPFRAGSGGGGRVESHISRQLPGSARKVGSLTWMDPGDPAVREEVVRVVQDIVRRYAVAGVILDDYFYPYPGSGIPRGTFPDSSTYARYQAGGGTLAVGDWRRSNIDNLIRELQRAVSSARSGTKFGVSPFGIYRPNVPAGVAARVDQYSELFADPVRWLREGWVDYLSPQLYWPDAGPQSFSALLSWWRSPAVNPRGVPIYPSIAIDRLGGSNNWPASEIAKQLRLEETISPRSGGGGFILWSIKPLQQDMKGVGAVVAASGVRR